MIGAFIIAWMKQELGVTAIIGTSNNARIYPMQAPQNAAFPRVTYQIIAGDPGQSLTGPISLEWCTVQIDCWGGRGPGAYKQAYDLAEAICGTESNRKLDGYYGATIGSIEVRDCHKTSWSDTVIFPTDGSDDAILGVSLDFDICYVRG